MPQTIVWILIAPGFDEETMVSCLCQMRQAGTAVTLAGTPVHRVVGAAGLVVHPDCSLAAWLEQAQGYGRQLVIIPGGPACATRLLSDARVYQGIQNTLSQCGQIAVLAPNMLPVLSGMGVLSAAWHEQFFIQENGDTANFIHYLVHFAADTGQ